MQFLWRYIDDMVGKGLDVLVLVEMLFYAALSLVPTALPLAILLASLMTFGNLGERFELLAMKAAGLSLLKIMRPLIIVVAIISVGSFYFQNIVTPIAQVKLYTLLLSMRQKSPELDIPEATFYKEISGFNVYVKEKEKETGLLKDMMIYDYSKGFDNAQIIVADSGRLKMSVDKKFLVLSLMNGESFENLKEQGGSARANNVPYRRETFSTKDLLIEFDANFNRMDESFMENQYAGKNIEELSHSIDSMTIRQDSIHDQNSKKILASSYKRSMKVTPLPKDTANEGEEEASQKEKVVIDEKDLLVLNFDSLYQIKDRVAKASLIDRSVSTIESIKSEYYFTAANMANESYKLRRHLTEWHRKFSFAFACFVFFFIGAPLGAIIRKGGLGMPVVISVVLFIVYYIIDNMGFKMAKDGIWAAWQGIWLSTAILSPLGIFLTYKAAHDSAILNPDIYTNALKKLLGRKAGRNIARKDVIIFEPNYTAVQESLTLLTKQCNDYLLNNKRWISYIKFWDPRRVDLGMVELSEQLELLIEEMSNSAHNLELNKMMDYPIMKGYELKPTQTTKLLSVILGAAFPIGFPLYLIAMYQRKLQMQDLQAIIKANGELQQLIINK
jgi:lipopolysaccharide export system permease protein